MTLATPEGWGGIDYGAGTYGAGTPDLQLLAAAAVRENVVRLTFNTAPFFSGIRNPNDASNPARYSIVAVTAGARAVRPILVVIAGSVGLELDVTVDRPFSGWPEQYRVAVNQLVTSVDRSLLDSTKTSFVFDGLKRFVPPKLRETAAPTRDIANRFDPILSEDAGLAVIPVDDTADYAFDEGVTSLRKRIHRRLVAKPGRFAHLGEYGLGVLDLLKTLNRQRVRAQLKADAEVQISQEPEVESVAVSITTEPRQPSIMRFRARVSAPKINSEPINMDFLFNLNPTGQ